MSVACLAREVVISPASAAAKTGAVAELMFQFGQTPWYKVLQLNLATASGMKVVCTFPVRVKGFARQEASRVHVWRWKRAALILVVRDAP